MSGNKSYYNRSYRGHGRGMGPQRFEAPKFDPRFDGGEERGYLPMREIRQNLSASVNAQKNDPLYREDVLLVRGCEASPMPKESLVYPAFYAIDRLSDHVHKGVASVNYGFSLHVTQSAFRYYVAAASYARLLKVLHLSGRSITSAEEEFMSMMYSGGFNLPNLIGYYLDGIGNTMINHREVRIQAKPRNCVQSKDDNSIGWFGAITAQTHYLYAAYPCLAVYATRIQMDILYSNQKLEVPDWNLPEDIRPLNEIADTPTANLLGYAPARKLPQIQLQWLYGCGFNWAGNYVSEHPTIPFLATILCAVHIELRGSKIKVVPMNKDLIGSLAQTVTTRVTPGAIAPMQESKQNMLATLGLYINGSVVVAAESLRYLQYHTINDINSWSIYKWNNYTQVPDAWITSANTLYDATSEMLKLQVFRTAPYSPSVQVWKLYEVLNPGE